MTIRQVSSPVPLPPCGGGHTARLMKDSRRAQSGGGCFVECRCCHTRRHATLQSALQEWAYLQPRRPSSAAVPAADAVQLGLGLEDRGQSALTRSGTHV